MEKPGRGRPKVDEEKKAKRQGVRFSPELWKELEELVPGRGKSAVVNEALRRELARRRRLKKAAEQSVDKG